MASLKKSFLMVDRRGVVNVCGNFIPSTTGNVGVYGIDADHATLDTYGSDPGVWAEKRDVGLYRINFTRNYNSLLSASGSILSNAPVDLHASFSNYSKDAYGGYVEVALTDGYGVAQDISTSSSFQSFDQAVNPYRVCFDFKFLATGVK